MGGFVQELWVGNEELVNLYEKRFGDAGYLTFKLGRTNNRGDGMLFDSEFGFIYVLASLGLICFPSQTNYWKTSPYTCMNHLDCRKPIEIELDQAWFGCKSFKYGIPTNILKFPFRFCDSSSIPNGLVWWICEKLEGNMRLYRSGDKEEIN